MPKVQLEPLNNDEMILIGGDPRYSDGDSLCSTTINHFESESLIVNSVSNLQTELRVQSFVPLTNK